MSEVAVPLLFLAAVTCPFVAVLAVVFGHWLTDLAWRQK